jgi:hypothetical protein
MARKNVTTKSLCTYCKRPIRTTLMANKKQFCGNFCAALWLILEDDKKNNFIDDIGSLDMLLDYLLHEGSLPLPVKVRFSDLDDDENFDLALNSAPEGYRAVIVQIADSGTPDWRPPRLGAKSGSSRTARSHAGA